MKKKILMVLFVLGVASGCGKVPVLSNGEEAMVSFDNSSLSISVDDLYKQIKDNMALDILIDMIDKNILLDKYPDVSTEADDYAKEQLESIKSYYVDEDGNYDEASLISALQSYYKIDTVAAFEEMLRLNFYRTKAVEDYAKEQISDKQINDYYKKEIVGDISCKHILIKPEVTDEMTDDEKKTAEDDALKLAKDIIKKLKNGEKFDDLAKEYSQDESNASNGGDLGFFNKGQMVEEFEKAAYALKLNAYTTTPVKTSFGYHIILKTGEEEKKALEDIKDDIIKSLSETLQQEDPTLSINALVDLRKEYGVKIEDSEINSKYSTFISNQLIMAQNNANSNNS